MKIKHAGLRRLYEANMAMHAPAHPGELVRESMDAMGWTVVECSERLGVSRSAMSRLLNGHAAVSLQMALALERLGWCTAAYWLRLQSAYDLAQVRREGEAAA